MLKAMINWHGLRAAARRMDVGGRPNARDWPVRGRMTRRPSTPRPPTGGSPRAEPRSRRAGRRFITLFRRKNRARPKTSRNYMRRRAPRHRIPQPRSPRICPSRPGGPGAPGAEDEEMERAVVQVMTYLIENENAALQVPARFIAQIHPHFREVLQLLAVQIADEARHVEVFTRRATLRGGELGLSTVSGRQSLKTLLDEPDFALASFLLSVLGEGTFLNLLWFLERHAPDPLTRRIALLVAQDEARHVAFGVGHLQYQLATDPALRERLALAVTRRHEALAQTSGLNEEVFDALILMAAGSWRPEDIAAGYARAQTLKDEMRAGRKARLEKLGFSEAEAADLSALHTRNFM